MQEVESYYDMGADCWYVRVPFALPAAALERARQWILRVRSQTYATMGPGDQKEALGLALKALREGRIRQVLVGKGEQTLFQSTHKMNPDRTIFVPK